MSEPLSSTEIEDVLSSIRRLVSDDIRPANRPQPAVAAMAGDKLILTPALRVVETASEPAPVDAPPMFVAVPRAQITVPEAPADLGRVVASVGAAVDAADDVWESETGDADMSEQDFAAAWSAPEAQAAFDAPQAAEDHFEYHDAREADAAQDVPAWAQQQAGTDEPGEDAVPPALDGMIEPDPLWADAAAASAIAGLSDQDEAALSEDAPQDEDDLDAGMRFDEEVLRELVRDILREELAGKMGERITRNIRKLVRAEIARAMLAQDFE